MIRIHWMNGAWRVEGYRTSFMALSYTEAFFFIKYEADIDADFIIDYILND